MVKDIKYSKAIVEVLYILNNLQDEIFSKIPDEVIKKLKENADLNYEFKPNASLENIEDLGLSKEAKAMLAVLYKNYICSDEEKIEFNKILLDNQDKLENDRRAKFSTDKLFKNNKNEGKNVALVEVKKENFILKIVNKIKMFFSKYK